MNASDPPQPSRLARLPIFYGWIIVAIAFVTMAIGINARTAFSLLFPEILNEFGWDRGVAAGAFSFGFFVSAFLSPFVGRVMDLKGPRVVVETGVLMLVLGLGLAAFATAQWQIYATLGIMVSAGANLLGYGVQSQFIPHWFVRRRGLAIGIAFAGVGVGSIILLPWMQILIARDGWRWACLALALITAVLLFPLNLLLRKRPQDIGLHPDGDAAAAQKTASGHASNVVDTAWASVNWTLARAMRTARFWWIGLGYFAILYAWYAVQVHQTKYLVEIGVSPDRGRLGARSCQPRGRTRLDRVRPPLGSHRPRMVLGDRLPRLRHLLRGADRLQAGTSPVLLYTMVLAQGFLGYSATAVLGPIVAEIFEGPNFGSIFGTLMLGAVVGGATGPWITGVLYDTTGNYNAAFWLGLVLSIVSALAIFIAAPGKVRLVAGRMGK